MMANECMNITSRYLRIHFFENFIFLVIYLL